MAAGGGGAGAAWGALGLAGPLAGAAAGRRWARPTAVQAAAVPPALLGRDVLARAATGSGKTAAYLLPGLHRLGAAGAAWRMLVLVPTRELCEQVREEAEALLEALCAEGGADAASAPPPVSVLTLPGMRGREQLRAAGDLVVSTPGRLAACLADGSLDGGALRRQLEVLVVDEADLLLTYGYEKDLEDLAPVLSEKCHRMLFSATSSPEVDAVAKRVLRDPVVVATESPEALGAAAGGEATGALAETPAGHRVSVNTDIRHSLLRCRPRDKLLTTMTLLKTGLVKRKVLIFVGTIDQGFRVKLFLGHFGLHAALLNAELPLNSRHHTIQSFNKGLFDLLIATDSVPQSLRRGGRTGGEEGEEDAEGEEGAENNGDDEEGKKKKKKKARLDPEFGVARGIDFKGVNTVLNFDAPPSVEDYFHRAGRTGRAGKAGAAVTLTVGEASEKGLFADVGALLEAAVGGGGPEGDRALADFGGLTSKAVENMRYRGEDVARAVTRTAVKEARAKELRQEILNSERLHSFFEKNQRDLSLLRHDRALKPSVASHLKHVPQYLKDGALVPVEGASGGGRARARRTRRGKNPLRAMLDGESSGPKKKKKKVSDAEKKAAAAKHGSMLWGKGKGAKK